MQLGWEASGIIIDLEPRVGGCNRTVMDLDCAQLQGAPMPMTRKYLHELLVSQQTHNASKV